MASNSDRVSVLVRLPKKERKQLHDDAQKQGMSVNDYVRYRLFGSTPISSPGAYSQLETRVDALAHSHSLLTSALADAGLQGLEKAITDAQALLAKEDK